MGLFDTLKSIVRPVDQLLRKTKVISTLAPAVGALTGRPGLGSAIGSGAAALGYQKGGRVLKAKPMKKGGMVQAPKAAKTAMKQNKKPKALKKKKM